MQMLRKLIAAVCHSLIFWSVALAQSEDVPVNQIGFEIGPHFGYLLDLNFSPLNYRESGILLSLDYKRNSKNGNLLFVADLDYTYGKLKTDADDFFTTPFHQGNIEVSVLFKLRKGKPGKLTFFIGPQYNSFFQYLEWGDERESWSYLMAHGLNFKCFGAYNITTTSRLETSLSIPLLSNLVRPPYNGFDQYIVDHSEKVIALSFRGEPATFDKFLAFDWKTTYRYQASDRVGLLLGYMMRYQRVPGANELTQFQNQFTTGLAVTW